MMRFMGLPVPVRWPSGKGGQTMVEYVIIASMLVLSLSVFSVLLYTFKVYGGRVLDLVASDYP